MFGPLTVTVVTTEAGGVDRHNNPVLVEAETFPIAGCNLQQRSSDEELDARDTIVTTWVLFGPPPSQHLRPVYRIRIDAAAAGVDPDEGQTYATFEIVGEPDVLGHIDGVDHHIELILKRAEL